MEMPDDEIEGMKVNADSGYKTKNGRKQNGLENDAFNDKIGAAKMNGVVTDQSMPNFDDDGK